jgi:hypothetical protein
MRNMKHETQKTPSFYVVQIFGVSCIGREYGTYGASGGCVGGYAELRDSRSIIFVTILRYHFTIPAIIKLWIVKP